MNNVEMLLAMKKLDRLLRTLLIEIRKEDKDPTKKTHKKVVGFVLKHDKCFVDKYYSDVAVKESLKGYT